MHLEFGHDAGAPKKARQALNPLFSDPDDPIADAVNLSASELVANVVTHTADGGAMDAWDPRPDLPLRLEVSDSQPGTLDADGDPDISGRGLAIVDRLADGWGVDQTRSGKVVWAEFDRNSADAD